MDELKRLNKSVGNIEITVAEILKALNKKPTVFQQIISTVGGISGALGILVIADLIYHWIKGS